jgi:hypothetical protein
MDQQPADHTTRILPTAHAARKGNPMSKTANNQNPNIKITIQETNGVFEAGITITSDTPGAPKQYMFQAKTALKIYDIELQALRQLSECVYADSQECADAVDAWTRAYWQIRDKVALGQYEEMYGG